MSDGSAGPPPVDKTGGWLGWAGVALVCLCGIASAVLELLFVPLYIGSVVVPVSVLAAVVANLFLPRWGRDLAGSAAGAVLPVLCWVVVLVGLSLYNRPEGDLFVLGVHGEKWNYYALVLFGALAAFIGVARTSPTLGPAVPARRR